MAQPSTTESAAPIMESSAGPLASILAQKALPLPIGFDSLLTSREAAQILRVTPRSLNRQIAAGLGLRKVYVSQNRVVYRLGDLVDLIRGKDDRRAN